MKILKRLLRKKKNYYNFKFIEFDDGDACASFKTKHGFVYLVDLDWSSGVFDVEFGLMNGLKFNTTNAHDQYKVLNTISEVVKVSIKHAKRMTGEKFHSLEFKSSNVRNGNEGNGDKIRNKFFIRFINREYPDAKINYRKDGSILIKFK